MMQSGTLALASCGRVSVEYCQIVAGGAFAARFTDSFTECDMKLLRQLFVMDTS